MDILPNRKRWLAGPGLLVLLMLLALPVLSAYARDDTRSHPACQYCNMDRQAFGYSRMLIEYTDGTTVGTCSLHCTVRDLTANITMVPCRIWVGDYRSKELLDASSAFWVIGGDQTGVMSPRAKWAFGNRAGAEAFVDQHGGRLATFYEALSAAYEDLYLDARRSLERVQERRAQGWEMCPGHGD